MIDLLQEIFETLKKNKMRTTLTGLSVSWGIFILIVLLGAGNGLQNGVIQNFSSRAVNRVNLYPGRTSIPHNGLKSDRQLSFTNEEVDFIREEVSESRLITARLNNTMNITYGNEFGSYEIRGVMPNYWLIEKLIIKPGDGRFINHLDMKEHNKVIVLDKKIADLLFPGESALGKTVKVGNLMFKVVGINSKKEDWGGSRAYIPFTTSQSIFNPSGKFYNIVFTVDGLNTKEANDKFNETLRTMMSRRLNFNPEDEQALWISNAQSEYVETMKIFGGITLFVTIIGILTLIAGIVGVSNIMLVSVKERTREIGIRKAIGAKPSSILKTIILESIIITTIFGYIGLIMGIGLTEIVNFIMEQAANGQPVSDEPQMSVFTNPTVEIGYAIFATIVLIISGVIAGYLPARKAVKVKPIEAMRQE
ncbi:MAG: ABC transporter permease [Fermentimonas caenicola]|jgi:putative ABC transport system permease protein|uniref:ABC transporter permease n=1 Tax=Lascolabacillus TaxID=1924067 RepID=UPI0006B37225|nr:MULTISPECIES: ABC transporter permease [Lascolabacillus]MBP7103828.1 ABC transporter permease [Fermentimonas sp.]MDD3657295.1 ABC transporter permease [Lascolabacillus sp.]MDI9625041.1 ABC transporter permease [Bacteroidota bacterium]